MRRHVAPGGQRPFSRREALLPKVAGVLPAASALAASRGQRCYKPLASVAPCGQRCCQQVALLPAVVGVAASGVSGCYKPAPPCCKEVGGGAVRPAVLLRVSVDGASDARRCCYVRPGVFTLLPGPPSFGEIDGVQAVTINAPLAAHRVPPPTYAWPAGGHLAHSSTSCCQR